MPRSGGEIHQLHGGLVAGVTGAAGVTHVSSVSDVSYFPDFSGKRERPRTSRAHWTTFGFHQRLLTDELL